MSDIFEQLETLAQLQHELSMQYLKLARTLAEAGRPGAPISDGILAPTDTPTRTKPTRAPKATESVQKTPPPFYVFLIAKQNKEGPQAEVAKRIAEDNDFPRDGKSAKQTAYLKKASYPLDLRKAFNMALASYKQLCARYEKQHG